MSNPKIDDYGYKKLFSNKTIFRQLLETFVKADWVSELDFDSSETLDKSFISDHYKETESDLVYKVKIRDREAYIFILIEFQSSVNRFMALRILNYVTNFYMDYVESNKGVRKLPPVFPILLYNGDARWTAPTRFEELIDADEPLKGFTLKFEYFKLAENEFDKEELLKIKNIVSTLFLAESFYDVDLLVEEILELFEKESDKIAVSLFLNWFKQLFEHGRIDESDYNFIEKKIYSGEREVKTMLITALKKERERLYLQGKKEGRIEGERKGRIEGERKGRIEGEKKGRIEGERKGEKKGEIKGKIEVAKNLISFGMNISEISELTGISEEELKKLKSEINEKKT